MNSASDEKQSLLDRNQQPSTSNQSIFNPVRWIRSLIGSRGTSDANSNDVVQEMDTLDHSTSSTRPANYGYLEHIQSLKPYLIPDKNKSVSKKVK
jgi:hypothetical protein